MAVGIIATIVAVSSDNRVVVITAVPAVVTAAIAAVPATAAPEALQTHQFPSPGLGIVKYVFLLMDGWIQIDLY